MTESGNGGSILKSRKAQIVVIGIAAVLGITLGGAALGMTDEQKAQAINAVEWLIGLLLGGHTISDVAHGIAGSRERVAAERETTERARIALNGNGGGSEAGEGGES
jgi:hypothetical protein